MLTEVGNVGAESDRRSYIAWIEIEESIEAQAARAIKKVYKGKRYLFVWKG